jgi:anaerobic selenocysteine-containing dehydrogenase
MSSTVSLSAGSSLSDGTHASVCPLDCPDTCSLHVTVRQGRVVRVDGSDRNPFTSGFICAKVRRYPERVYSPLRVLYPQRRVGPKGEGRFERISWDEAIGTIAGRFREIVATDGPEAILPYHYGGSSGVFGEGAIDAQFFHRLGAAELLKTICAAPTGTVYAAMYGRMGGVPPEDYPRARAILLWGVNPSATSIHLVPHIHEAQRAGAFVAVIDPRRTPLARRATVHLQPRPGTDVVLALAMVHELIRTGRVDAGFVAQHVLGFETLAATAHAWPIERAADVCDVPVADVQRVVEAYADAVPAVIRCGWGVERNRNGGNAVRVILALPAVAGKFGVRGGGMTMSLGRAAPIDAQAVARPELRRRRARQVNMTQLGRVLAERQTPPLRALFVYNANPVAVAPNQNLILRGLARDDLFTVVHEQVLTDTARYADILLPATTFLEQADLCKSYGHYYVQYADPVIAPQGEAKSNVELFGRLAAAMGFAEVAAAADENALLASALRGAAARLGGVDGTRLRTEGIARIHFSGQAELIQFGTDFPTTASGKVEICPPALGPIQFVSPTSAYPLTLISPASGKSINSILAEVTLPAAMLTMHPADAQARRIADGAVVRVFNDLGEVELPVRVTDAVRPGVVSMPKGAWRCSTRNGATSTALVPDHLTDIGAGACFNDARVEVQQVGG